MTVAFWILEKDFFDESREPEKTFFFFKKHATDVGGNHCDAASAVAFYVERHADAWEWSDGDVHEYLVWQENVDTIQGSLEDLTIVKVSSEFIGLQHYASEAGKYGA